MWKCPKCGKEFKNTNQNHYCGKKPETIEEYIMLQDEDKQADLFLIRQALKQALPEAEERISWSMPTYWKKHNILHFAASKKHIGFYPGPEAVEAFQAQGGACGPAKAANAGGVATSALEMSQNSQRLSWTFEEVDSKLHQIMINIYKACKDASERYGMAGNLVAGANIAGFEKVCDAMIWQGVAY